MRRWLPLILGLLVTVACLVWLSFQVNWAEAARSFQTADYRTLPLMLVSLLAFYTLKAVRWRWLLRPIIDLKTTEVFPPLLIGFAANNLLPAHLGEFVRVFVLRTQYKAPAPAVLSTVVLERIFDVIAILSLFAVGMAFSPDVPANYRQGGLVFAAGACIGVIAAVVYLLKTEWFMSLTRFAFRFVPIVPDSFEKKILSMLESGAVGLSALRSWKTILAVLVNSLVQWLMNGLIAYFALQAFDVDISLAGALVLTGALAVAVTVPSTPGYVGVIQACFVAVLLPLGVNESSALAASFYYQLSMYIPVTLSGLFFLNRAGLKISELMSAADRDSDGSGEDAGQTVQIDNGGPGLSATKAIDATEPTRC